MDENHRNPSFLGEATENSSSYFGTAPEVFAEHFDPPEARRPP
jgi:hypothetical protein